MIITKGAKNIVGFSVTNLAAVYNKTVPTLILSRPQ